MHQGDFDINLEEIAKIEGAASLTIKVRQKRVEDLRFAISEWKRFYTQAIEGKPVIAVPQLVSRICGTCSIAHLLAAIKAIEKGLGIDVSQQTQLLRQLLYFGLIIRDHALHLYLFSAPDLFGKNSILDFDENDPLQHQLLDDAFAVKEVGNQLSIVLGGRSVHAPYPTIGGFTKLPQIEAIKNLKDKLLAVRKKIIRLIEIYANASFSLQLKKPMVFVALSSVDFSFLEGMIKTSAGETIKEEDFGNHLNGVIIPYSQARGFRYQGKLMMVGALARLNLDKDHLHPQTKETVKDYLELFPSTNLFHNNLAQAIEILHSLDSAVSLIDSLSVIKEEKPVKIVPKEAVGTGAIEAPRGTLYYQLKINQTGVIEKGEIIVPTGQNQVMMEQAIGQLVQELVEKDTDKESIVNEAEKLIRAFDPCMSCAAHFLKVKWR